MMSYITLEPSDGTQMQAYLAQPKGNGPFPAVIVYQEAFGVNAHIRSVADCFAEQGYLAISPELFHRTAPAFFEGNYNDFAGIAHHFQGITESGLEADIKVVWEWLQAQAIVKKEATVCVGYCMGGRIAFLTNTIVPVKAAVSYYGGRIVPDLIKRANQLHAPMLFFWGGLDKHITPEQVDAVVNGLKSANKPFTSVVISDADHGFNCNARASYNRQASAEAWAHTLAFLGEKLKNKSLMD